MSQADTSVEVVEKTAVSRVHTRNVQRSDGDQAVLIRELSRFTASESREAREALKLFLDGLCRENAALRASERAAWEAVGRMSALGQSGGEQLGALRAENTQLRAELEAARKKVKKLKKAGDSTEAMVLQGLAGALSGPAVAGGQPGPRTVYKAIRKAAADSGLSDEQARRAAEGYMVALTELLDAWPDPESL